MVLVAPFLWFISIGALFVEPLAGFGLYLLAWIAGISGFGLFIYGLVAKSDLEREVLARQAMVLNRTIQTAQSPQPQGKYCPHCGTPNPSGAGYCVSCGVQFPAG